MTHPAVLFAPGASAGYGAAVAQHAGMTLGALEERRFEDGEHKIRPLASVRGRDVYVVHSLYGDADQSANDKLVRMLLLLATLRDAGAARRTAVCPYLAYARKDRRTKPRDPVSTRYVAELFEAAGLDCMVTLDVHNVAAYQNAFRSRTEHLDSAGLLAGAVAPRVAGDAVVVVAPDAGATKRAELFRQRLQRAHGTPVTGAFAEKYRSGGEVTGEAFVGDVAGRTAIIVDDLISAGTTVARVAAACRARGARRVLAAVTHGVFAAAANATLGESAVEAIVTTDTIPPWRITAPRLAARLVQVPTAPLVGSALAALHADGSLATLDA